MCVCVCVLCVPSFIIKYMIRSSPSSVPYVRSLLCALRGYGFEQLIDRFVYVCVPPPPPLPFIISCMYTYIYIYTHMYICVYIYIYMLAGLPLYYNIM